MEYGERIRHGGFGLSESLDGSLPTIDQLKVVFFDNLKHINQPDERTKQAVEIAQDYKQRAKLDYAASSSGMIKSNRDLPAILLLDGVEFFGTELRVVNKTPEQVKKWTAAGNYSEIMTNFMEAKFELQSRVSEYHETFRDAPDDYLYNALEAIMYEAKCILANQIDLENDDDSDIRKILIGLLAEYKVFKSLRSAGWDWARYGSVREDTVFKTDIIVPIGGINSKDEIAFQVKSTPHPGSRFAILPVQNSKNTFLVKVPMHPENSQFTLSPDDTRYLVDFTAQATAKSSVCVNP